MKTLTEMEKELNHSIHMEYRKLIRLGVDSMNGQMHKWVHDDVKKSIDNKIEKLTEALHKINTKLNEEA